MRFAFIVGPACEQSWKSITNFDIHREELQGYTTAEKSTPIWTADANMQQADRPENEDNMYLANTPNNKWWLNNLINDALQLHHGILSIFTALMYHGIQLAEEDAWDRDSQGLPRAAESGDSASSLASPVPLNDLDFAEAMRDKAAEVQTRQTMKEFYENEMTLIDF
jgi:hypothetical protein